MHAQVTNPANGWNDLAYAARPSPSPPTRPDQGQLHPRRRRCARPSSATSSPCPIAHGQRLQRLHRHLPRVPARRPLPQGAHRLGPALQRLHGHAARHAGPACSRTRPSRCQPTRPQEALLEPKVVADIALRGPARDARSAPPGARPIAAYEAALPDDGGQRRGGHAARRRRALRRRVLHLERRLELHRQPAGAGAAQVDGAGWTEYADDSGEVPVTLEFPQGAGRAQLRDGRASSGSGPPTSRRSRRASTLGDRPRATPPGTYRFVVDGQAPRGRRGVPYTVTSREFEVTPWSGITVEDLRVEPDGRASFDVGPRNTYEVKGGGGPTWPPRSGRSTIPTATPTRVAAAALHQTTRRGSCAIPPRPATRHKVEWYCLTCSASAVGRRRRRRARWSSRS